MIPEAADGRSRPRRVLLVEDNEAAGKGLARLLEVQGFAVTMVHDGEAALRALAATDPPEFVLTDLQLPDLDGREVARCARRLVPPPRVVVVTGWDPEPDGGADAPCGIYRVLTKPVDVHELVAVMNA
jgi:DNA-binding response OmpR family regulator